jgi:ABC-type phosphate transport system auxiliary subunit
MKKSDQKIIIDHVNELRLARRLQIEADRQQKAIDTIADELSKLEVTACRYQGYGHELPKWIERSIEVANTRLSLAKMGLIS